MSGTISGNRQGSASLPPPDRRHRSGLRAGPAGLRAGPGVGSRPSGQPVLAALLPRSPRLPVMVAQAGSPASRRPHERWHGRLGGPFDTGPAGFAGSRESVAPRRDSENSTPSRDVTRAAAPGPAPPGLRSRASGPGPLPESHPDSESSSQVQARRDGLPTASRASGPWPPCPGSLARRSGRLVPVVWAASFSVSKSCRSSDFNLSKYRSTIL